MVSSVFVDAIRDPARAMLDLYDPSNSIDDFPSTVSRHFAEIFSTSDAFHEIPVLSTRNPPEAHSSRALVRFRAMVQDTSPSPEMYLAKLGAEGYGGWGQEATSEDADGVVDYSNLRECTVLWAVSVPGESGWCTNEGDGPVASGSAAPHEPTQPHKFPLSGTQHLGVRVKIYGQDSDTIKSTEVYTFVGILTLESLNPELESTPDVPTLHVLFSRPHLPTLVPRPYPADDITQVRVDLINWIAEEALGGDRDAAEWALLVAISRIQSRTPPIFPPSLTLSRFPSPERPSTPPSLSHVLEEILPISLTLPLSLDLLNRENFTPESKEEDLHSGWLQVPSGSNYLVTESGIQEGKLVEKGIMNVRAMQEVMTNQSLAYIFPFSQFSFPTDSTFIVLAEGKKSAFFQTNITLPLQPQEGTQLYKSKAELKMPSAEKLASFRALVLGAKSGNVQMGEDASKYVQEDFVKERQQDKTVTADDLIHRMTIARLLALSSHEKEISIDTWERMKTLDARRKARSL
ncbi:hypothetical protein PLICRDRAFT_109472 [Plicaturopsis crispa FD-325 SS-3]|nr:hypothetical protein PLICRDRAFT_109472 [Plicaturopsis crispa FD-325 SS-3]